MSIQTPFYTKVKKESSFFLYFTRFHSRNLFKKPIFKINVVPSQIIFVSGSFEKFLSRFFDLRSTNPPLSAFQPSPAPLFECKCETNEHITKKSIHQLHRINYSSIIMLASLSQAYNQTQTRYSYSQLILNSRFLLCVCITTRRVYIS